MTTNEIRRADGSPNSHIISIPYFYSQCNLCSKYFPDTIFGTNVILHEGLQQSAPKPKLPYKPLEIKRIISPLPLQP